MPKKNNQYNHIENNHIILSIIIPSYNEKKRITRTLDAYLRFFQKKGMPYEIIVADYSSDGSKKIIKQYQKRFKTLKLLNIYKPGKGLAVFDGFKRGKGKFLGFTDADNAVSPEEFYRLFNYTKKYDAVIGSRGLSRSHVVHYHQGLFRRIGSFVLGVFFVRILFGLKIKDTQCGAKIFEKNKIMSVIPKMRITGSIFDIELLWRFKKIGTIKEVPIRWIDDKYTTFRWKQVVGHFFWLFRVRLGV